MIATLNIVGLFLTFAGACVAALSVMVSDEQAKAMSAPKFDENPELAAAFKSQSKHAFWGLMLVAAGSLFQLAGLVLPLFFPSLSPPAT